VRPFPVRDFDQVDVIRFDIRFNGKSRTGAIITTVSRRAEARSYDLSFLYRHYLDFLPCSDFLSSGGNL